MTTPHEISRDIVDVVLATRRQIHRRPELSNEEFETTALVRRELARAGITDVRPVGQTGLATSSRGGWTS